MSVNSADVYGTVRDYRGTITSTYFRMTMVEPTNRHLPRLLKRLSRNAFSGNNSPLSELRLIDVTSGAPVCFETVRCLTVSTEQAEFSLVKESEWLTLSRATVWPICDSERLECISACSEEEEYSPSDSSRISRKDSASKFSTEMPSSKTVLSLVV